MSELKPCPFCGDFAEIHITDHTPSGYDYTPRCIDTSCCGRLTKKYSTREAAVAMWNRRVNDERQADRVDKECQNKRGV